jgi:hypothetical protein
MTIAIRKTLTGGSLPNIWPYRRRRRSSKNDERPPPHFAPSLQHRKSGETTRSQSTPHRFAASRPTSAMTVVDNAQTKIPAG